MTDESRLLISGASGHLGTSVLQDLLDRGIAPERLVATTRSPERLDAFAAQGVDVRRADLDDAASIRTAFAGVDRMLLISTDEIVPAGRRASQHRAGIDAAVEVGVSHIIYTSGANPEPPSPMFWDSDHWDTEEHLRASGAGWTILRNGEYMEVHVNMLWHEAIETGRLYTAAGDGGLAVVAREDCARAAAAALASDSSANGTYGITGPEALSTADAMAILSDFTGTPIEVLEVTPNELAPRLKEEGHPDWLISAFVALDQGIAEGFYDTVTDDVERLTGTPPMSLQKFLSEQSRST